MTGDGVKGTRNCVIRETKGTWWCVSCLGCCQEADLMEADPHGGTILLCTAKDKDEVKAGISSRGDREIRNL